MQLRSGTFLWPDFASETRPFNSLTGDRNCEVVVLGGGITGALVAYEFITRGVHTILLDQNRIGRGSTAASTGLLQYEVDTPLCTLIKKVGTDHAVHAYRRGLNAIDELEQLAEALNCCSSFERRDSLYFASSCWHERRLRKEFECRRQYDFDVDFLSKQELAKISSIDAVGAIRSRGDAQIDPFAFTQGLIEASIKAGLEVFEQTRVVKINEAHDGVDINTEGGRLHARRIVYATGYNSEQYLATPKANLNSTYAVASQPNASTAGWPDDMLLWETARPYFYARRTHDNRALIGGEDTEFSDDHRQQDLIHRKTESLLQRFSSLFPSIDFTPEYAWGGTFAETKDGLAYIGTPPERPSAYFALGYGGNGITFSAIAAKLIRDLYMGKPTLDAEVFRFGR